jgi:hypothetical protein
MAKLVFVAAPSSGASRHLLPQGEKDDGAGYATSFTSPLVGEFGVLLRRPGGPSQRRTTVTLRVQAMGSAEGRDG